MKEKTIKGRLLKEKIMFTLFRSAALLNGIAVIVVVWFIGSNGIKAISWTFLTQGPLDSMTKGGILPCIIGTFCLALGAILFALPVGIATAVYLNEYARPGRLVNFIRFTINNLAGVPSIVFGLFGLAFFCIMLHMGVSILAGSLTLAVMSLPVIIGASEEAIKAVPWTYREASYGIGATKWQTIHRVVLPAALPGILTGTILALSRAAGETAPIMFTGAVFFTPQLPKSILSEVMALPYHIYVLATAGINIEETRPMQYGTALVLIALVLGMNLAAIVLRQKLRKKMNL
jgi:phosphate transport system permease protein